MNSDGEILTSPFSFTNDFNGFQKLLKHLDSFPINQMFIEIGRAHV